MRPRSLQYGDVTLSVMSKSGREAVVAMLGASEFFGEGCLAGQPVRMGSATATSVCRILVLNKREMVRLLHDKREMSDRFLAHMLARNIRIEEDLIEQLFNSSEKRLARTLLLARFGKHDQPVQPVPPISQERLAKMVGTTRSRVNRLSKRSQGQQLAADSDPARLGAGSDHHLAQFEVFNCAQPPSTAETYP